jgi:hypothetical protein
MPNPGPLPVTMVVISMFPSRDWSPLAGNGWAAASRTALPSDAPAPMPAPAILGIVRRSCLDFMGMPASSRFAEEDALCSRLLK